MCMNTTFQCVVFPYCCYEIRLLSKQKKRNKTAFFFSSSRLLLACLPCQHYYVTGNSVCPSLPFDTEHQEWFHYTAKIWTEFKGRPLSHARCFAYITVTYSDTHDICTHTRAEIYAQIHIDKHITTAMCDYKGTENQAKTDISMLSLSISIYMRMYILRMELQSRKVLLMMEVSGTNLHFACVIPPITALDDNSQASFEKSSRAWTLCLGPNPSPGCGL